MSDVQQVDWSNFRVANEGAYGGGSELEHHRDCCDWKVTIDDLNPSEISELASGHAAKCTGLPMPRKAPEPPTAMGALVQHIWGKQIAAHLSAPRTGAGGAGS